MEDKRKLKFGFFLCVWILIFQIFLVFLYYLIFKKVNSPLLLLEIFHIGAGIPISIMLFLIYNQRFKVKVEEEEVEELRKKEGRMFEGEETLLLVSQSKLQQTEKYLVPIITFLLSAALILVPVKTALYFHGKKIEYLSTSVIPLLLIGLTFPIFLFSRYILGLSKDKIWKYLGILGSFLGSNAIFTFLTAISITLKNFKLPKFEWFIFYLLVLLLIIVGIEFLLNIIATFYRSSKAEKKYPFDSKILYIISLPEEVIPSFSEIIDYQFGFRITQTWFYQFVKKRLLPLFLIQISLFLLLTSIVIVKPYERCFIEFLGKPIRNAHIFGPGLHLKFPWPIGKVRIFNVDRVKSIRIGAKGEEAERVLWTEKHYEEEFNWIIASEEAASQVSDTLSVPVNFLTGVVWVYYKLNSEQLYNYAYLHSNPDELLRCIVENEFTRLMMGVDFHQLLTLKRMEVVNILKENIQKEVNKHNLGVDILTVNLGNVHPPVEVASSFEKVVGAMEKKEAKILEAEAYSNKVLTLSKYKSSQIITEAEAYKFVRSVEAEGQRQQFLKELSAFRKSPRIYKYRHYLRTLEESLIHPKKYIVISSDRDRNVTILDLEKGPLPETILLGGETETGAKK